MTLYPPVAERPAAGKRESQSNIEKMDISRKPNNAKIECPLRHASFITIKNI